MIRLFLRSLSFTYLMHMRLLNENLNCLLFILTIAAQAAAAANVTSSQNIGHDGEEIETKHQPGQLIPQQQQGHGPHGPLTQQPHPLQAHQQVRNIFVQ